MCINLNATQKNYIAINVKIIYVYKCSTEKDQKYSVKSLKKQ